MSLPFVFTSSGIKSSTSSIPSTASIPSITKEFNQRFVGFHMLNLTFI
jgi:3-hydroxyacyl-CoA dehydrogenase